MVSFPSIVCWLAAIAVLAALVLSLRTYRFVKPSLRVIALETVYRALACEPVTQDNVVAMRDDLFQCALEARLRLTVANTSALSTARVEKIRLHYKYPAHRSRRGDVVWQASAPIPPGGEETMDIPLRTCDNLHGTIRGGIGILEVPDALRLKAVRVHGAHCRSKKRLHADSFYHDREILLEDMTVFAEEDNQAFISQYDFYAPVPALRFLGHMRGEYLHILWVTDLSPRLHRLLDFVRRGLGKTPQG